MSIIKNLYLATSQNYLVKNNDFCSHVDISSLFDEERIKPSILSGAKILKENISIIYKISDENSLPITDEHLEEVNSIVTGHKYIKRIEKLSLLGYQINFDSYDDKTFNLNLQLIDGDLPEIIAHIVKDKYVCKITKITEVIKKLNESNPLNYDQSFGHNFYDYKLVKFLVEAALGMTSKEVWSGVYDVVGGIIIVKPNVEILCYHLIDFNKFKHYLKTSARLDNPSGSKMGYGSVYRNDNNSYIKLNFQIKA